MNVAMTTVLVGSVFDHPTFIKRWSCQRNKVTWQQNIFMLKKLSAIRVKTFFLLIYLSYDIVMLCHHNINEKGARLNDVIMFHDVLKWFSDLTHYTALKASSSLNTCMYKF